MDENTVNLAYCVGLLSSIGCLVLLDSYPKRMADVVREVETNSDITLDQAEATAFGANHEVVGAYLLGLWGFVDAIVEAIAFVSSPSQSPGRDNNYLTILHAATILGPIFPPVHRGDLLPFDWDMAYLHAVGKAGRIPAWTEAVAKLKAEWKNA